MMIQCPKCACFFSDSDSKCPNCGTVVYNPSSVNHTSTPTNGPIPSPQRGGTPNAMNMQMQKLRVVIIALCSAVAVLSLALVAFFIFKGSDNTRTRPDIEEDSGYYGNSGNYNNNYSSSHRKSYRSGNEVIVYSKSSDGFLNIRETPSSKGRILGKFRNGPHGAVYLGQSGSWTEIDCDGIVGYVYTSYLSYTPTVEVTVDIDIKWLTGPWYPSNREYAYLIFNNGTYAVQYYYGTIAYGTYKLEGDQIVFSASMVRSGLGYPISSYERFRISVSPKRIGNMTKRSLVKEDDLWRYSGELVWTYAQFKEIQKDVKRYVGK